MKRQFSKVLAMAIAFAGLTLTSCDLISTESGDSTSSISGAITGDVTLASTCTLSGSVTVEEGATLTIPAGAVITAEQGFENYILVKRGGKIIANGTADAPIIFKGKVSEAGYWGGIVINGYAPVSGDVDGYEGSTEIDNEVKYGGTDVADNSGSMTYVKIYHTGAKSSANVEHNGLTLNGVGNGTTIENIYIEESTDDAIEFFGGSVNVTNLMAVNPDDDMFDFTQGYTGTLTNAYGIWTADYTSSEEDPRGVEADGNLDGVTPSDINQSNFSIVNMTIVNNASTIMHDVIKVRRGAIANISNAIVMGSTSMVADLIDTNDSKGAAEAGTTISLTNSLTNAITGSEINGDYGTIEDGNTGADTSVFDWTGFDFDNLTTGGDPATTLSEISGAITSDATLSATCTLSGSVTVEEGATLTIPAGAVITAEQGFENYILVKRGGKIIANGTADSPITFKGKVEEAGYWGGIVINGYAPVSGDVDGYEGSTEIDNEVKYGGTDVADNSGSMTYVKIYHTGAKSSANVEHNGLTLNGVGNGTTIENIYIEESTDDAIEFFGGSVNVTNLMAVNPDDDMFDFTQGYTGTLTNAYGIWTADYTSSEEDPRGVEADGNLDGVTPSDINQSNFSIVNMTIINNASTIMHDVIKVRRGAIANISNAIVMGSTSMVADLIDTNDSKGAAEAGTTISLTNSLTNAITGSEINGDYGTIEAGNTGADTSVFAWTGFDF